MRKNPRVKWSSVLRELWYNFCYRNVVTCSDK